MAFTIYYRSPGCSYYRTWNTYFNFLGIILGLQFKGTEEKAAIAGDFAMLEDEVAPVIKALLKMELKWSLFTITWYKKSHMYFSCTIGQ